MNDLILRAREFAATAHKDQVRKYGGESYIVHPVAVSEMVASVTDDPEVIAAALLHDTVEDTSVTLAEIDYHFGARVAAIVSDLTDVSKPSDGNRQTRRAIDREHTSRACPEAKTIKLADVLDNSSDLVERDPKFAAVYLEEKRLLLTILKEGDPKLYQMASDRLSEYDLRTSSHNSCLTSGKSEIEMPRDRA